MVWATKLLVMGRTAHVLGRIAGVVLLASCATVGGAAARARATTAVVDPESVRVASFDGWGTALSWGANVVGSWPDATRTAVADLLFSPTSGLGLNVVRYQIGGGQNPNWQANGCAAQRPGSPLPTFEPSQGTWDWTADPGQRWFAQRAQTDGANNFLGFASSPPWWMTISGCSNGASGGGNNLQGWWGYDGNGSTSYSHTANDSVTFAFSGTGIDFYGSTSPDSGHAAFSVDGGAEQDVDFYSPGRVNAVHLYSRTGLTDGAHTLTIRVTGTRDAAATDTFVSIDHVVVSPSGTSVSNQVRGTGTTQFNYHWRYYEAYADYLTEVAKHYRDTWGINFNYLDPLNEPEGGWNINGNQEGTGFDQHSQDEIINRVGQSLAAKGLTGTGIADSDGFSESATNGEFSNLSAAAKSYVSAITTHTYGNSTADANTLNATAAAAGKKLWMSEYGTGASQWSPGSTADPADPQAAINLAARIVGDMTDLRPSAWILWDGIENYEQNVQENNTWGAIWAHYGDSSQGYTVAKQYYGYENFTKYIRPGARFIASGDANSIAAYDPNSNSLTIVTYNDTTSSRSLTYDLSRFGPITSASAYRTSGSENFAALSPVAVSNNQLAVSVAAKSVTTYVMNNVLPSVELVARHSGKCADVNGTSLADGASVIQWSCSGGTNQQWTLRNLGNGYYHVIARHSGKCLNVAGASTADGAWAIQYACDGTSTNEQWAIQSAGGGYYTLVARHSGKCLDVNGASTNDGAQLIQWTCDGGTNQQWSQVAA